MLLGAKKNYSKITDKIKVRENYLKDTVTEYTKNYLQICDLIYKDSEVKRQNELQENRK